MTVMSRVLSKLCCACETHAVQVSRTEIIAGVEAGLVSANGGTVAAEVVVHVDIGISIGERRAERAAQGIAV